MREFFAIWVAVRVWGDEWVGRQVVVHTDSAPARDIWVRGSSPDRLVMRLVRPMFLWAAQRNVNVILRHVPGEYNVLADSLSRLQVQRFHQLHPSADLIPCVVPEDVWAV